MNKISNCSVRFADIKNDYNTSLMWHETNAQKDGTIYNSTKFPSNSHGLVYSGPHFFLNTPIYKTPNRVCKSTLSYSLVNLESLPLNFLPRTN